MIKRVLTAVIIAVFAGNFAAAQTKIGYANPSIIMSQLPDFQTVTNEIQRFMEQKDAALRLRADSLQRLFDEYEGVSATLSKEVREQRESDLMAKNQEFENMRQQAMQEVQMRQNALLQPIQEKVMDAIAEVAKELGLDLVLNDRTSQGSEIIFYAASDQPNLTERVINKLKQ